MGQAARSVAATQSWSAPMPQPKDDLSRTLVALDQHSSLIAVVELSLSTWLVGGMVPGIERDPLKKLVPDEDGLLKLLHRPDRYSVRHKLAIYFCKRARQTGKKLYIYCVPRGNPHKPIIVRLDRAL